MAKPLQKAPPTSAAAAALLSAGLRATQTPAPAQEPSSLQPHHHGQKSSDRPAKKQARVLLGESEPLDVKRQFVLGASHERVLDDLLAIYKESTGARLNHSTILRCLIKAAGHAIDEIRQEAKRIISMDLPSKADEEARVVFEAPIIGSMVAGVRSAGVYYTEDQKEDVSSDELD